MPGLSADRIQRRSLRVGEFAAVMTPALKMTVVFAGEASITGEKIILFS
ncbi:hypothetical protein L0128_19915 [candidate division KSB1 bacterium]|nr:hypothetical protein [candidate division KSB1 bacterium]